MVVWVGILFLLKRIFHVPLRGSSIAACSDRLIAPLRLSDPDHAVPERFIPAAQRLFETIFFDAATVFPDGLRAMRAGVVFTSQTL